MGPSVYPYHSERWLQVRVLIKRTPYALGLARPALRSSACCSGQIQELLRCTQVEGTLKAGTPIKARILDISKKDGVVDLSLRQAHTAAGVKKAAKALAAIEASLLYSSDTMGKIITM